MIKCGRPSRVTTHITQWWGEEGPGMGHYSHGCWSPLCHWLFEWHESTPLNSLQLSFLIWQWGRFAERFLPPPPFFSLFRATPEAYGSSQARGWIGAAAMPQPQQRQTWAESAAYTTAHGGNGSLTHWVGPGMEPASSWIPVGFVTLEPRWELLLRDF